MHEPWTNAHRYRAAAIRPRVHLSVVKERQIRRAPRLASVVLDAQHIHRAIDHVTLCWSAGAAGRYDRCDHSRRPRRHVLEGQTPEDQNPDYEQGVSRVDMDGVSDRRSEEVESEEDDQEAQDVDEEDADKAYGEKRNQPRELGLDVDQSHAPQEPEGR